MHHLYAYISGNKNLCYPKPYLFYHRYGSFPHTQITNEQELIYKYLKSKNSNAR